jgi:hypothetical protein
LVEKEERKVPPESTGALYKKILIERYGMLGAAGFLGRKALKMKI